MEALDDLKKAGGLLAIICSRDREREEREYLCAERGSSGIAEGEEALSLARSLTHRLQEAPPIWGEGTKQKHIYPLHLKMGSI